VRKVSTLIVAVAAIACAVAIPLSAAQARAGQTFTDYAKQTHSTHTPDGFAFNEALRDKQGKRVGTDIVGCQFLDRHHAKCQGTWTFSGKGTIHARGTVSFRKDRQKVTVFNGTGDFKHAKGVLKLHFITNDKTKQTFVLN
jgi:hypothetical protein